MADKITKEMVLAILDNLAEKYKGKTGCTTGVFVLRDILEKEGLDAFWSNCIISMAVATVVEESIGVKALAKEIAIMDCGFEGRLKKKAGLWN